MGPAYRGCCRGDTASRPGCHGKASSGCRKDYRDASTRCFNANRFGKERPGFWRYVKTKPKRRRCLVDDLLAKAEQPKRFQRGRDYRPHDDPDGQRSGPVWKRYTLTPAEADMALVYGLASSVPRVPLVDTLGSAKYPRYGTATSAPARCTKYRKVCVKHVITNRTIPG